MNPKLMSQLDASMAGDQAHVIEPKMGKRALKKAKKDQREKKEGLGAAWFGMKAPEVTDELKRDLEVLKMRGAIDPKRFYKKTGTQDEGLPKYFQVLPTRIIGFIPEFLPAALVRFYFVIIIRGHLQLFTSLTTNQQFQQIKHKTRSKSVQN